MNCQNFVNIRVISSKLSHRFSNFNMFFPVIKIISLSYNFHNDNLINCPSSWCSSFLANPSYSLLTKDREILVAWSNAEKVDGWSKGWIIWGREKLIFKNELAEAVIDKMWFLGVLVKKYFILASNDIYF
jgi:hypothetical protein